MGTGPLRGALARIIRAYLPHKCEAVHINKKNWKGIATRRLKRLLSIALQTYSRRRLSHLIAIGAGSAPSRVMPCTMMPLFIGASHSSHPLFATGGF